MRARSRLAVFATGSTRLAGGVTRRLAVIAIALVVAWVGGVAHANPPAKPVVALLPLDAPAALEIYGQPVASELARALGAAQIEVVVVGAKASVPDRVTLIVDGTIVQKGDVIYLSARVRHRATGATVDTAKADAALASLDRAAGELSVKLLPIVRAGLAEASRAPDPIAVPVPVPVPVSRPSPPHVKALMISAIASTGAGAGVEPLRAALADAAATYATAHHRAPLAGDGAQLTAKLAAATVAHSTADLAIAFEVAGYTTETERGIPVARARVRVRVATASAVLFDRVVVTDSIVGDRAGEPATLAARTAREVLAILAPHLRAMEPSP